MIIPRDKNGNLVCYWHYPGDGPRILIPGCYGSLYDRPDYCNCPGGVFDPGKVLIKTTTIAKLEKQIESLSKEVSELRNSQLESKNLLQNLKTIPTISVQNPRDIGHRIHFKMDSESGRKWTLNPAEIVPHR